MKSNNSNSEKSVSYQKKDGRGHARPSFFWYDNDKDFKVCFLMTHLNYNTSGDIVETHPSPHCCDHLITARGLKQIENMIIININGSDCFFISCSFCGIFLFQPKNGATSKVWETDRESKVQPTSLCKGPDNILISPSRYKPVQIILLFQFTKDHTLTLKDQIEFPDYQKSKYRSFVHCDTESYPDGLVIMAFAERDYFMYSMSALCFRDRKIVWKLPTQVGGMVCDPRDVTSDHTGRIYVADGLNRRVLILHALDGQVLQVVDLDIYAVGMIAWHQPLCPTEQAYLMLYCLTEPRSGWHVRVHSVVKDRKLCRIGLNN